MRLDKYLSGMSIGTRSEVKKLIKSGRVFVQKQPVLRPEYHVDPDDVVEVDGEQVTYVEYEYYMMNKPKDCVCAVTDEKDTTVVELIRGTSIKQLFPVGRLDKDTEGLLLLTNDGALSHRLLSPRRHVWKTYLVKVDGKMTQDDFRHLREGMDIGDQKLTLPARVSVVAGEQSVLPARGEEATGVDPEQKVCMVSPEERKLILATIQAVDGEADRETGTGAPSTWLLLSIREGRYHQIKRMMAALSKPVVYLKRLSMGGLLLDGSLQPGQYRPLTEEEVGEIRNM